MKLQIIMHQKHKGIIAIHLRVLPVDEWEVSHLAVISKAKNETVIVE